MRCLRAWLAPMRPGGFGPALGVLRSLREELADGLNSSQARKRGPRLRHWLPCRCRAPPMERREARFPDRKGSGTSKRRVRDRAACRVVRRHPGSFCKLLRFPALHPPHFVKGVWGMSITRTRMRRGIAQSCLKRKIAPLDKPRCPPVALPRRACVWSRAFPPGTPHG